jgi:NTP pyrophosphatase (non-canonical NTP hydrolase)
LRRLAVVARETVTKVRGSESTMSTSDSAEVRHLLQCLTEECAEVIQAVSKALRFGLDDDHQADNLDIVSPRKYIVKELNDVMAVVDELQILEVFPSPMFDSRLQSAKMKKLNQMMDYSREKGML